MDLNALTLLVEIIDCGNLSQAARKLKMTRANVSYHLSQLEKSVGAQLVKRSTRRAEPTEIGMRLYEHGRIIKDEAQSASDTIASLGQGMQGRVGISVPSGYGQIVMSDWFIEFKRLYPGIQLDVLFVNRTEHLRDDIDIAIRVAHEPPQTVVARHMGDVHYVLCATRHYAERHGLPESIEALTRCPVITTALVGQHLRLSAWRNGVHQEVMLQPSLSSENFPFLRQAVLADLGLGLVPDYVVKDKLDNGEVITALNDYRLSLFGVHLYLLYLPNRHQTRAMRTCVDFLLAKAAQSEHLRPNIA